MWRGRQRGRGFWRGRGWPGGPRGRGGPPRQGPLQGGGGRGRPGGGANECHNCGEKGHWIRECPYMQPRQSNQMSYDDYDYYDEEDYYQSGSVKVRECFRDAPLPCKILSLLSLLSTLVLPKNNETDPRPFISLRLNGKQVNALVDSGSQITAIDYNVYKKLRNGRKDQIAKVPFPLVGAGGERLDVVGQVKLDIEVSGCLQPSVPILIIRHLNSKFILGADFLSANHLVLDVKRGELRENESHEVLATEEVCVPANSERTIGVKTGFGNSTIVMNSSHPFISDCIVSSSAIQRGKILVQNASMLDFKISRNELLGQGSLLDSADIATISSALPEASLPLNSINTSKPKHQDVLDKIKLSHLPSTLREKYETIISQNASAFSLNPNEIGHCKVLPQSIVLKDPTKVTSIPPYRISPHLQPVVKEYVENLLKTGVLQKSCSPFCSPLMLVKKPNAKASQPMVEQYRLVHDYRHLNSNTVRNAYPLHHLYDLLDKVSAAKVWSVIDLSSGFWNQELHPDSRKYTAFAIPGVGHMEYTRSAQGLCNSPAAFQRLLDHIVRDIPGVYVYIDDVVICSENHEAHLKALAEVLRRFKQYNLKCRPHKIQIATAEINYLGYNLSHQHGIRPGQAKIKAISDWQEPNSVKQIRQFLGLCSFFRRCIPHFSSIASPLTKLTRKDAKWETGELPPEAKLAFARLKRKLIQRPCLTPPNFNERFYLTCDASKTGFGAVLSQFKNGVEHPIAFASRTLKESEQKHASFHLEYMAMVWAIRHFKPYLSGKQFTLRTDHRPLLTMNKSKCQIFDRYLHELSQYDFETVYLKGEKMPADALSRKIESVSLCVPLEAQINISWSQIKSMQQQDKFIKALAVFKLFKSLPRNPQLNAFVQANKHAVVYNSVVCFKQENGKFRAYAPTGLQASLLRLAHESPVAGHINARRTLARLEQSWYWPTIKDDVWVYCTGCQICNEQNQVWSKAPIPIGKFKPATHFNARVHTDLLGMLPDNDGHKYVLVLIDAYSKFLQLVPLPDKRMETVSAAIYQHWISLFSVPKLLVSDLGKEYTGHMTKSLADRFGYPHHFSSPGHPASNGQAENSVKKILQYVRKYVDGNNWKQLLPDLRMAHNMNLQSSINTTPFQAAFSMRPKLPGDLIFPEPEMAKDVPSHVHREIENYRYFRSMILDSQSAATARMERAYNKRAKARVFEVGDKVFLLRPHTGNQFQKFQPRFRGPLLVVGVTEQNLTLVPMYSNKAKHMKVHKNNVRLANALTQMYDVKSTQPPNAKPATTARKQVTQPTTPLYMYDNTVANVEDSLSSSSFSSQSADSEYVP